jgi:hypothetical protein
VKMLCTARKHRPCAATPSQKVLCCFANVLLCVTRHPKLLLQIARPLSKAMPWRGVLNHIMPGLVPDPGCRTQRCQTSQANTHQSAQPLSLTATVGDLFPPTSYAASSRGSVQVRAVPPQSQQGARGPQALATKVNWRYRPLADLCAPACLSPNPRADTRASIASHIQEAIHRMQSTGAAYTWFYQCDACRHSTAPPSPRHCRPSGRFV